MKFITAFALTFMLLFSTGCPSGGLVPLYLNLVAEAATSVIDSLANSGVIPPGVATEVKNYAKQVSTVVIQINNEYNSSDSKAEKWTKISSDLGTVLATNIPGLPPAVGLTITAVRTALLVLEAALSHELNGTDPNLKSVRKAQKLPTPKGKSFKDAVKTAQANLAR